MDVLVHIFLFLFASAIMWFFAGLLIEATEAVAKKYNRQSFTVAFFILGFLTSIGELSVMVNSMLNGVPTVSVGNLVGSSLVTVLLIIPALAVIGNGVRLRNTLNNRHLILALFIAVMPALFVLDAHVSPSEGLVCILAYITLFYFIEGNKWWKNESNSAPEVIDKVEDEILKHKYTTAFDILKIVGGAIIIFLTGNLLVAEATYFANLFHIPSSLIGLLILSIGTNAPELVIAVRSIHRGNISVAFGNYVGSTIAVTLFFGVLAIIGGPFSLGIESLFFTVLVMVLGFIVFYLFARSKQDISRREGSILLLFYLVFLSSQFLTLIN